MEVKKNLNGIQRKMLDQIYTEQFDKQYRVAMDGRKEGLLKLQAKVLKDYSKDKEIKKMLEAGKVFHESYKKHEASLKSVGLTVSTTLYSEPHLEFGSRYNYNYYTELPELAAYDQETRRLDLAYGEKKREMRAKIYGISATYEEVDAEIRELLKSI